MSSSLVVGQVNTLSPYSKYGIGVSRTATFNGNVALSGTGRAWRPWNYRPEVYDSLARSGATINDRNTNYINVINPASFSNFSLTTYEAGIYTSTVTYESTGQSQTETTANFTHLGIAFPIGNRWGMAFGIKPFSQIGYDYQRNELLNGSLITYDFDGSGGVNEIFVGTGVQLGKSLSVGVNAKFLTGQRSDIKRVVYSTGNSNFFNTLDQTNTNYNDFNFDVGLQYFKDLEYDYRLIVGVTASPISNLNAVEERLIRSYEGREEFELIKDTVFLEEETKINVDIGSQFGGGIAYEKKGKWIVMMDYNFIDKKNELLEAGVRSSDNHQLSFGFENYSSQSAFGSYFNNIGYRIGGHYYSSLVEVEGTDISEFGISFGLALPLRKSFSTMNFAVELGERGTMNDNLVRERFFNFYFGVTINDKWFIKRKYD